MSKGYQGSSIEFRAKELLSSMQGSCPDMVWNELNVALQERRSKANEKWLNKFNVPRAALIVSAFALIATLATWKFIFSKKNSIGPDRSYYQRQDAQSVAQIANNTPPPVTKTAPIVTQPNKIIDAPATVTNVPSTTQTAQLALNSSANKPNPVQKPAQHNSTGPSADLTNGGNVKAGVATSENVQADTTFTLHRVGAPISSGAAIQDTLTN